MEAFRIEPAAPHMPAGLEALAIESRGFDIRNVSTVAEQWRTGEQRFDKPGEILLVAVDAATSEVIGVGGLTQCPHVEGALRVRRFYVSVEWRRRGVARAIARHLIDDGLKQAATITCNAQASDAAPPFWEAMGFNPVDIGGITHELRR